MSAKYTLACFKDRTLKDYEFFHEQTLPCFPNTWRFPFSHPLDILRRRKNKLQMIEFIVTSVKTISFSSVLIIVPNVMLNKLLALRGVAANGG